MCKYRFKKIDAFASGQLRDESGNARVLFGGNAIVRIEGEYVLT